MIFVGSEQIFYVNFDVWQVFVFEIHPLRWLTIHHEMDDQDGTSTFLLFRSFRKELVLFLWGDL